MRLKCPNCGAEYEVDSAMIPDPGRDVQCAACGHGWFQDAEGSAGDGAVMLDVLKQEQAKKPQPSPTIPDSTPETPPEDDPKEAPEESAEPGSPNADAAPENQTEGPTEDQIATSKNALTRAVPPPAPSDASDVPEDSDIDDGEEAPTAGTLLTPDRRSLDPGVRKVLEEEAARERKARVAEVQPMSTQPDLGLDDLDESDFSRPPATPQDLASSLDDEDGVDLTPTAVAALAKPAASQADRLPDVDQINSSLRSTTERDPREDTAVVTQDVRQNKRGFRLGFSIVLIVTTLAILAYFYSPRLADQYPTLRDPLARYVDNVNALRDRVDGALDSAASWLGR